MPFRDRFDCLWCGTPHVTRAPTDLEGWAQLCPTCLGKAGSNPFLRARLRPALAERGGAAAAEHRKVPAATARRHRGPPRHARQHDSPRRPAARFPDDWFLRRGRFEHGAIHDTAWAAELDVATRWIDGLPLRGRIEEPAAGTGFFSPLLADAGRAPRIDEDGAALDIARERLVAHRLARPPPRRGPLDPARGRVRRTGSFASFLTGRVRGAGLDRRSRRCATGSGRRLAGASSTSGPTRTAARPAGIAVDVARPALLEAGPPARRASRASSVATTGRFFLLGGEAAEPRAAERRNPGGILRRDVPPREPHDRDGRLRRDGRGDDRGLPPRPTS